MNIFSKKIIIIIISILLTLNVACSTLNKIIYHPNINQGNYLVKNDIKKLNIGMTKKQIIYVLGSPMIYSQFGQHVWYYIFRKKEGNNVVQQQTLTLTFNQQGYLRHIDNKLSLIKEHYHR